MNNELNSVRNGFTAIGAIILVVALVLTVISVVLAVNLSPWWFIATVILGGYTLVAAVWTFMARKMLNNFDRF